MSGLRVSCFARFPASAQLWKGCRATFLVVAAKCTNIDSDIPRQAPPTITGRNMAPRGTRKSALLATWTRGCLARVASAPAGTGAGSALPPHPSLPAAVVASTVPTSITDAISTGTSSQPPAMTSRRSPCGSPSAWRPFRRPATSRSMLLGPQRAEEPGGNGPELPRTRNVGTGRPERTAFRLPVPRATERSRSLVPGGRRAEHSAHPAFRLDSGTPYLVCGRRSYYGRKTERTRRCAVVEAT